MEALNLYSASSGNQTYHLISSGDSNIIGQHNRQSRGNDRKKKQPWSHRPRFGQHNSNRNFNPMEGTSGARSTSSFAGRIDWDFFKQPTNMVRSGKNNVANRRLITNTRPQQGMPMQGLKNNNYRYHMNFQNHQQQQQQQTVLQPPNRTQMLSNTDRYYQVSPTPSCKSEVAAPNLNQMYLCPNCTGQFFVRISQNNYLGKVPLVLKCNHTVCQECIYKHLKNQKVKCPVCEQDSEVTHRKLPIHQTDLIHLFPPNYYILGFLVFHNNYGKNAAIGPRLKVVPFVLHQKRRTASPTSASDSLLEISRSCASLNEDVEDESKNTKFSLNLDNCTKHIGMQLEYFCDDCETYACCYCVLDNHNNHQRRNLCDLDEAETIEFNQRKTTAVQIMNDINRTLKEVEALKAGDTTAIKQQISQYFMNYHSKLTAIENGLLEDLGNCKMGNNNLNIIRRELAKRAEELQTLISFKKKKMDKKYNLQAGLEKLRELENIPRFLAGQSDHNVALRFVADPIDPVSDALDKTFFIEMSGNYEYYLETKKSDVQLCASTTDSEDDSGETEIKSTTPLAPSVDSIKSTKKTTNSKLQKPRNNDDNLDVAQIEVQHINSIENFYVQLKISQPKLAQLNKEISDYVRMGGGSDVIDILKKNKYYLVLYSSEAEAEQQWLRARLVEIDEENDSYEVFFIDYGKTQTVKREKIKEMPSFLMQTLPFAIQCSLYNPMDVEWNANAHYSFARILNGKDVCMIIKSAGIEYVVDLLISGSNQTVTSVIDILIYCTDSVKARSSSSSIQDQTKSLKVIHTADWKIFPNSQTFQLNQTEKVVIANVIDPYTIVIHKVADKELFDKMNKEMKKTFREMKNCIPIERSYVLVHYKYTSQSYHRGFVKSVDFENDKVQVLLVDWGLNVVVSTLDIKPIREYFTRLESQAILVKLAHIIPSNNQKSWLKHATEFLQSLQSCEELKIIVNSVKPEIEVALFDISKTDEVCINTMMVQYGFAESTGNISKELYWINNRDEEVELSEDNGLVESFLKKINDEVMNDPVEQDEYDGLKKRKIRVMKVDAPDVIWVKFHDLNDKEKEMGRRLVAHYGPLKSDKTTFEIDDECVAKTKMGFSRGKIIEIIGDSCKMFLPDKVDEVLVPKTNLYEVDPYFKIHPFAVQCHLANICPAGDSGTWSISSTETLQEIFALYKEIYAVQLKKEVFGSVQSTNKKKTLPLLMWYCLKIPGGAVEPDRIKYVSINDILVTLGYAFKITKSLENMRSEKENTKETDETNTDMGSNFKENIEARANSASGELIDEKYGNESWIDLVEEEIAAKDKLYKPETSVENEIETNNDEESKQNEEIIDIDDWLPAIKFQESVSDAKVTCGETGGHLYIRHEKWEETYTSMEKSINDCFNVKPPKMNNSEWEPGELCTIKYTDNKWYRGKILRVNGSRINVLMVDFGSDHEVFSQFLFKEILYPEVPVFATKVKLYNVYSKSVDWLPQDYDIFLNLLTDWCRIVVKSPHNVALPLVEVYNDSTLNINEELVRLCPNLVRNAGLLTDTFVPTSSDSDSEIHEQVHTVKDGESEIHGYVETAKELNEPKMIDKQLDEKDYANLAYKPLSLPEKLLRGLKIPLEIGGFINYDKVALKEANIMSNEDYYNLIVDIQDSIEYLPHLKNFKIGKPCLAQFSEDQVYYRARITNAQTVALGFIDVFFVDYGNSATVALEKLYEIKPEFLELPQQTWEANLNYTVKNKRKVLSIMKFLTLLEKNDVFVKLINENPRTVDLFNEYDSLCYESLIKEGSLIVLEDANKNNESEDL